MSISALTDTVGASLLAMLATLVWHRTATATMRRDLRALSRRQQRLARRARRSERVAAVTLSLVGEIAAKVGVEPAFRSAVADILTPNAPSGNDT